VYVSLHKGKTNITFKLFIIEAAKGEAPLHCPLDVALDAK